MAENRWVDRTGAGQEPTLSVDEFVKGVIQNSAALTEDLKRAYNQLHSPISLVVIPHSSPLHSPANPLTAFVADKLMRKGLKMSLSGPEANYRNATLVSMAGLQGLKSGKPFGDHLAEMKPVLAAFEGEVDLAINDWLKNLSRTR